MPARKRTQEAKRAARPRDLGDWEVEPVGVIVQTEDAWRVYDEVHQGCTCTPDPDTWELYDDNGWPCSH